MKKGHILISFIMIFSFSSFLYAVVDGPTAEIEKEELHRPLILEPKLQPTKPSPIEPPPGVVVKPFHFYGAIDLNTHLVEARPNQFSANVSGVSIPMLNSSIGPSQVERLISKIERVIKKLNQ